MKKSDPQGIFSTKIVTKVKKLVWNFEIYNAYTLLKWKASILTYFCLKISVNAFKSFPETFSLGRFVYHSIFLFLWIPTPYFLLSPVTLQSCILFVATSPMTPMKRRIKSFVTWTLLVLKLLHYYIINFELNGLKPLEKMF